MRKLFSHVSRCMDVRVRVLFCVIVDMAWRRVKSDVPGLSEMDD